MKILYRNIISRLIVVLLTINVFCSFVLSRGDLFALETSVQKDIDSKAFSCHSNGNRNALISNNHIAFDFLISKPLKKEDFVAEFRYSKKTFLLLTSLNHLSQRPFCINSCRHLLIIPAQDSLSAYLLCKILRI